ncbi:MAG TPA: SDR family NAD(P)-dependent oxidoreductase [Acidimicrobiales bacterium]|nr:SDR family NAD(P)-dependent oxidoreductase [Acidimicrobiales bacterium]
MAAGDVRTALVTGAASGIGRATVERLAADGLQVVGLDRDQAGLDATAAIVTEAGGRFTGVAIDITDADEVDRTVRAQGDLDVVVNAAGIVAYQDLAGTTVADLERVLAVNLVGTFSVCRAAAPGLVRRKGAIVNLASAAALNGRAYLSAYSASKGAVLSFSKALAVELAPDVRVNVVCPSAVDTPMVSAIELPAHLDASRFDRHPMLSGRRATAAEVAAAVAHLASEESGSTTGLAYLLDGGAAA